MREFSAKEENVVKKLRWGVLSTAAIGARKVIPGMQQGKFTRVDAIASRDLERSRKAATALGIPRAYGSYEELLADPEIDAIYNPLPNQLHVPWTIRAAQAGKHVLCEKPLALSVREAETLLAVRAETGVKIGEAFMIRTHPQWLRTAELIRSGRIGALRAVMGCFSYFLNDRGNIRNFSESGGGALYDIGCYLIQAARIGFAAEPRNVVASMEADPETGVDRLTSALLDFDGGQAAFTCSMNFVPYQRVQFFGTTGRIEIEIPFNAPPDRPTRIFIDEGGELFGAGISVEEFPVCDQYALQGDAFARAVFDDTEVPVPLEEAIRNARVIEALFASAERGGWQPVER